MEIYKNQYEREFRVLEDINTNGIMSACAMAPFDNAKEALKNEGYKVISLEQMAQLRIQEGKDSAISRLGSWTMEDFVYIPNKGIFLTKNSPIMKNAKKATNCSRQGVDLYLDSNQVEKSIEGSYKIKDAEHHVCTPIRIVIPTSRFAEEGLTSYAFGEHARNYGEFLKEIGIQDLEICLGNTKKQPFAKKAWFETFENSELRGDHDLTGSMGFYGLVRGIKKQ
ncbi:MAG: hypothetical protein KKE23_04035 [Nanoarchaeota archaeon]|nr:hypothetical protein [Nanoarchaeota archaeon]